MSGSERSREPIYVFEVDGEYLFTHYFQRTDIFSELRIYYNNDEYRFEIPEEDFPRVLELLEQNHYNPIRVDNIEEYAVVKEQYTEHKEILRNSVMNWSRDGYNFFVMESPRAVEEAVEQGATRLEESNLVLGL
jgi:methyltransferase-like protein